MFGALLEPLQVVELIRRELLGLVIKPTIEQSDILHEQLHQMMKFGQIALQQRIQYTPLARGGLHDVTYEPHDVRRRGVVLTLFGQDNTFAIRQIGRLAVLRMNLVAAGSPLAMSLLFHELGHHIEMICAMSPRDKAIRVERRSKWKGDINDLVAQVVAEAAQPKASQENKRAPHDTKWIRESLEAMLEEHFAHDLEEDWL
ncbi:MAG: hypothetical protein IPI35_21085 [Deltaproteobacteria bacterium]|nr:hypothetical protein [Deltaproteobacteria bacterium]